MAARPDATPARRPLALFGVSTLLTGVGIGALALPAAADTEVPRPASFTSTFTVQATAAEVVGDLSGDTTASAAYVLELNSDLDVLCYTVTTRGVEPPYQSPARTSTHIHEAPAGSSGPPRIVFTDPGPVDGDPRVSSACVRGPFDTGVTSDAGSDTGAGFTVAELEADPDAYYVDIHTTQFPAGSLRGQLPATAGAGTAAPAQAPTPSATPSATPSPTATPAPSASAAPQQAPPAQAPTGGVAAGFGGLAGADDVPPVTAALAAALVALGAGLTGTSVVRGRRRA